MVMGDSILVSLGGEHKVVRDRFNAGGEEGEEGL